MVTSGTCSSWRKCFLKVNKVWHESGFPKTYTKALIFLCCSGKYLTSHSKIANFFFFFFFFRATEHGSKLFYHHKSVQFFFFPFYFQWMISQLVAKLSSLQVQISVPEQDIASRIKGNSGVYGSWL